MQLVDTLHREKKSNEYFLFKCLAWNSAEPCDSNHFAVPFFLIFHINQDTPRKITIDRVINNVEVTKHGSCWRKKYKSDKKFDLRIFFLLFWFYL